MSAVFVGEHEHPKYDYVITRADTTVEVNVDATPEQFLDTIRGVSQMLGYNLDELAMTVYVRGGEGELWRPIHGVKDTTPLLLPLFMGPLDTKEMTENDYHELGHKILAAYKVIKDRMEKVKRYSRRADDTELSRQKIVDEFARHLNRIEEAVTGTEFERVFVLKHIQHVKLHAAAKDLNMSPRTWNRQVKRMTTYIGEVLYQALTPKDLKDLLRLGRQEGP